MMLPWSPTRTHSVPAPVIVPVGMAPPVAAGFSSTRLHAEPVHVPSEKLTTRVLSCRSLQGGDDRAPLDVLKLCIARSARRDLAGERLGDRHGRRDRGGDVVVAPGREGEQQTCEQPSC